MTNNVDPAESASAGGTFRFEARFSRSILGPCGRVRFGSGVHWLAIWSRRARGKGESAVKDRE